MTPRDAFRSLLKQGDTVLLHSSFGAIRDDTITPQNAIDALLEIAGTLIVPTFNFTRFGWPVNEPFDVKHTPSEMGIISELVRRQGKRSLHPFYSFAAIGRYADEIGKLRNIKSYGEGSVFDLLWKWDAKIMIIGLPWNNSMTYFHHVEEMFRVPWREDKWIDGVIVEDDMLRRHRVQIYGRKKGVVTQVEPMGKLLEQEQCVGFAKLGEAVVKCVRARDAYWVCAREMMRDPHLLWEGSYE